MSELTPPRIEQFVTSLYRPPDPFLSAMREEAEQQWIPIISPDTERLITTLCRIRPPKRVLEIGTAIGYSAICMGKAVPDAEILSIESRTRSVHKARANIAEAGMSHRIQVWEGKAEELLPQVTGVFDWIFIDAAKSQYRRFFELCEKNMAAGTLILSDNVLYKGMPCDDSYVPERRHKTIARRMREYVTFLCQREDLETAILPMGDGIALSFKMK